MASRAHRYRPPVVSDFAKETIKDAEYELLALRILQRDTPPEQQAINREVLLRANPYRSPRRFATP